MTSSNRPPSVETPATASNSFNTKYVAGTPEVSSTKTTFEIKQTHLYFSGKIKTETSTLGQLHELRTEDERYLTITVDMTSAKFVLNKILNAQQGHCHSFAHHMQCRKCLHKPLRYFTAVWGAVRPQWFPVMLTFGGAYVAFTRDMPPPEAAARWWSTDAHVPEPSQLGMIHNCVSVFPPVLERYNKNDQGFRITENAQT